MKHLEPFYGKDSQGNRVTPGRLLSATLECEWQGKLAPAINGYCEISPRHSYELRTKIKKTSEFSSESQKERNRRKKLQSEAFTHFGVMKQHADLEVAVISHCRAAAKEDSIVKNSLRLFDKASQEQEKCLYNQCNFRKSKAQRWVKGQKAP